MKKWIAMLLTAALLCSLAACGSAAAWSREGYFTDGNDNMLYIMPSDDEAHPGWYVGAILGEDMFGNYIEEKGGKLQGNIKSEYDADGKDCIVTLTAEGADGVALAVEKGETYHFTPGEIPEAAFSVTVNTEGRGEGQIAYAKEGEEPEFDDEYPSQTAYVGLEGPEVYQFAAKPDEGSKFMKWTKNGEDFSTEERISFEVTEDTELIAVFGVAGTDETYVDLAAVQTVGELQGLPDYGYSLYEGKYVCAFEQEGNFYRAVADCPEDVFSAAIDLDIDDDQHDEQFRKLVAPLKVERIDDLSAGIPAREELDALTGKTGQELFDEGWNNYGWNLDEMVFYMDHGPYSFDVEMEGTVKDPESFDDDDVAALTVKSVKFTGMGDMTALDE